MHRYDLIMRGLRFIVFVFLLLIARNVIGQNNERNRGQPNSLTPGNSKRSYAPKHFRSAKYGKFKVTRSPEYEFYKRVENAAKEKQKILRRLAKPQDSNWLYFGHRHPPKKHRPNRMKYCSECGIRH